MTKDEISEIDAEENKKIKEGAGISAPEPPTENISPFQTLIDSGLFIFGKEGEPKTNMKGDLIPCHSSWVQYIIQHFQVLTPEPEREVLIYFEETGNFKESEHFLKAWLENAYPYMTSKDISEIIEKLKNITYLSHTEKKKIILKNAQFIPLKNGVFDLKKQELLDFSPKYLFTADPVPIMYDADAECPQILKFLSEIVAEQDIPVIQELSGYLFLRSMPIHKAFMFLGEGANGKTTLINLLRASLGEGNVSELSLQQIAKSGFLLGRLRDKLMNMYADLPAYALTDTSIFKVLTGGDYITVDRKFKEPMSFLNHAKMVFSCNKLPSAKDSTNAFFRRWILLNFPNRFTAENADPLILQKITTPRELSGFFNWAMEGLVRLTKNKDFSYSYSTEQVQDRYERLSDTLCAFVKDCVDVDSEGVISKDVFFTTYVEYCRKNNIPAKQKNAVGKDLALYVPVSSEFADRQRVWKGIKFREPEEAETSEDIYVMDEQGNLVKNPLIEMKQFMSFLEELPAPIPSAEVFKFSAPSEKIEDMLEKLKERGKIIEPKQGYYEVI